jgi:hypothetical protein
MSTLSVDTIQGQTTAANVKLPAGYVIQTVNTSFSTEVTESGSSFVDTGLSLAITPKYSTSKVLVLVHQMAKALDGAGRMNVLRGSTSLEEQYFGESEGGDWYGPINVILLDSPATTSATTYKTQMRTNGAGTVGVNSPVVGCTITLMEIAQ